MARFRRLKTCKLYMHTCIYMLRKATFCSVNSKKSFAQCRKLKVNLIFSCLLLVSDNTVILLNGPVDGFFLRDLMRFANSPALSAEKISKLFDLRLPNGKLFLACHTLTTAIVNIGLVTVSRTSCNVFLLVTLPHLRLWPPNPWHFSMAWYKSIIRNATLANARYFAIFFARCFKHYFL